MMVTTSLPEPPVKAVTVGSIATVIAPAAEAAAMVASSAAEVRSPRFSEPAPVAVTVVSLVGAVSVTFSDCALLNVAVARAELVKVTSVLPAAPEVTVSALMALSVMVLPVTLSRVSARACLVAELSVTVTAVAPSFSERLVSASETIA